MAIGQSTIPPLQAFDIQPRRPAVVQKALLVAIILAITLGPRISLGNLGDREVDLRVQDVLLLLAVPVLALAPRYVHFRKMTLLWDQKLLVFVLVAVTVTAIHGIGGDIGLLRLIAFSFRGLEPFLLAIIVAGLYLNAGPSAGRAVLRALHFAAAANLLWVVYQYLTGTSATVFGETASSLIDTYGPRLIGEPSSFGTGYFFAFVAVLALTEYRCRLTSRWFALSLLAAAFVGALMAQSRICIGDVCLIAVWIILKPDLSGKIRFGRLLYLAPVAGLAFIVYAPQLTGRLSLDKIVSAFQDRILIWDPLVAALSNNPVLGIGTGALGMPPYPMTEAHNDLLRLCLDWGIFGAVLAVSVFVTIYRRAGRARQDPDASSNLHGFATLARTSIAILFVTGAVQESISAVMSSHLTMFAVGIFAAEYICHTLPNTSVARSSTSVLPRPHGSITTWLDSRVGSRWPRRSR